MNREDGYSSISVNENLAMIEPIKKTRVSEEAVEKIAGMIVTGEYPAGKRLPPERKLAEMLAITRSSLREALRRLEGMGFVTVRPGDGIYAEDYRERAGLEFINFALSTGIGVDEELLMSLEEMRRILTFPVLELAAERIDDESIAALREMVEGFPRALTPELVSGEWDYQFFLIIAKAARNPVFVYMVNTIRETFSQLKYFYPGLKGSLGMIAGINGSIVDALGEHDPVEVLKAEEVRMSVLKGELLVGKEGVEE